MLVILASNQKSLSSIYSLIPSLPQYLFPLTLPSPALTSLDFILSPIPSLSLPLSTLLLTSQQDYFQYFSASTPASCFSTSLIRWLATFNIVEIRSQSNRK